ncbi:Uncharacterized HTH-type transcriptional regulator YhjC [Pararobbsia alpina]|uniref:LysR family transcriptional regulator n=1 Tax=Pararobbsia alpina TaxID=621374 RepID=UPI0039A75DEF
MDRFHAMKVFTRVVETGSFSRAASVLDMPRPSVSVVIQQLEALLKVRLLQRTTRRLNLTADGAAYYESCVRILADVEATESALTDALRGPRGKLRVDVPSGLGRSILLPKLFEFHERYPDIELMIGFSDRPVDLIQEGVDCVIRVGELQDSSLVARRVGLYESVTVASPDYIARHGMPRSIEELQSHTAIHYFWTKSGRTMDLSFDVGDEVVQVKMNGKVAVNDADAYLAGALKGAGITQPMRMLAEPYLQSGELVELLPQWRPTAMPISAVYPHNRHLSPQVRLFVEWVAELFEGWPALAGRRSVLFDRAPASRGSHAVATPRGRLALEQEEVNAGDVVDAIDAV